MVIFMPYQVWHKGKKDNWGCSILSGLLLPKHPDFYIKLLGIFPQDIFQSPEYLGGVRESTGDIV